MENSNNTGKVIGSLALGVLAGVTLGILFAPRKGAKTREKIVEGAEDMTNELRKKINKEAKSFKKKLNKEAKSFKNKASKLEGFVEDKMDNVATLFKDKANSLLHVDTNHVEQIKHK